MAQIVVVFDFDKTIIDVDSDNWLLDELGFTELFNQILATMPWNSTMDRMMKEMHEKGVTIDEMVEVLKRTPMHSRIIPAIKAVYDAGCDLRILSDANRFYIETILKHHKLEEYFSEIHTNPGYVNEEGRVRISPYHDFNTNPHGCACTLCPPNMCKGIVMEKLISGAEDKTFIYLGDGNGDFCPSTKLRKIDYCMPRKDFPLCHAISSNPKLISADIHEWSHGGDLEHTLLSLINNITSSTSIEMNTNDDNNNNESVTKEQMMMKMMKNNSNNNNNLPGDTFERCLDDPNVGSLTPMNKSNSNSNNDVQIMAKRMDCKPMHDGMPMASNSHAVSVPQ